MADSGTEVDDILLSLGWLGRYQRSQLLMLLLPLFPISFQPMSVMFIGRFNDYKCADLGNESSTEFLSSLQNASSWNVSDRIAYNYGQCEIELKQGDTVIAKERCVNGYNFSEPEHVSFMSEWKLVCGREALSDLPHSMAMLGLIFGSFLFSPVSDLCGRKPTFVVLSFILLILGSCSAFMPNITSFLIIRFILGAVLQGSDAASFILMIELMPTKKREVPSQMMTFTWTAMCLIQVLIAYLMKDLSWRYSCLVYGLATCYIFVLWYFVEESIRWLFIKHKVDSLKKIINKIARTNKIDANGVLEMVNWKLRRAGEMRQDKARDDIEDDLRLSISERLQTSENHNYRHAPHANDRGILKALKSKRIWQVLSIGSYVWFSTALAYYGLLMVSDTMMGDLYAGFALNILTELPAAIAFYVLVQRVPRKTILSISHITTAMCLITVLVLRNIEPISQAVPKVDVIVVCISLIGKLANALAFNILYLYLPELLPTTMRTTGMGLASAIGRLGNTLSPFVRTLHRHVKWGPGALFTILSLVIPVLLYFLPETRSRELPQTLSDLERMFQKQSKPHSRTSQHDTTHSDPVL